MKRTGLCAFTACFFGILSAVYAQTALAPEPPRLRALILSGYNNHDWRTTTPLLKKSLVDSGRFDVRITEEPAGMNSAMLASYDVVVMDYVGPRWGEQAEQALVSFVRGGKGLVLVHGANYAFTGLEVLGDGHRPTGQKEKPWAEFLAMAGGYWTDQEPKTGHGRRHTFPVKIVDRLHPIAERLPESFLATDELYHRPHMTPQAHVLATALSRKETNGTGNQEPILWTVEYGQGRIFYTALGHDAVAMSEAGFVSSFQRGVEWAASGKCTIPYRVKIAGQSPEALRLLVVTGGHSYETSFYRVFEGDPRLTWTHAVSAAEAFQKDIRSSYDVVLLYDFTQDLSDQARKNLKDYVESGKGMVVLHHALADYQAWPWWHGEVVGGRYVMKPEDTLPASTYQHDVELTVETVGRHPILQGLGAMHLTEETYKKMWYSPDIQVLLKTDHSTSDGPLAWISPYTRSRVVVIQLGHDHQVHDYPGFRLLVQNAIRWAGNRLP